MDNHDLKQIINFIQKNCARTLTKRHRDQLYRYRYMKRYSIRDFRQVYYIGILNGVFPVCPFCNLPIVESEELTIDHIIPRAQGGGDNIENWQPMHCKCNEIKGDKMPDIEYDYHIDISIKVSKTPRKKKKLSHHDRYGVTAKTKEEIINKCNQVDECIRQHRQKRK